jgi:SHNi-TPR
MAASHAPTNSSSDAAAATPTAVITTSNGGKVKATPTAATPLSPVEAYRASCASAEYTTAKALLVAGDFEQALTMLEPCLLSHTEAALAPFLYLYGTTLLYSMEESTDLTPLQVEGQGDEEEEQQEEEGEEEQQEGEEQHGEEEEQQNQEEEEQHEEEVADDLQIAWENLEAARTLVESILVASDGNDRTFLSWELAQIALREGDLQRLNGRYPAALADYTTCLELRQKAAATAPAGCWDRRLADVHHQLALTYSLHLAALAEATATDGAENANVDQKQLRSECFRHYVACAHTLCGLRVQALMVPPPDDLSQLLNQVQNRVPTTTNHKTTGLEPSDYQEDARRDASRQVSNLRSYLAEIKSSQEPQQPDDEIDALLEEIQETIDEDETSTRAVVELQGMKAELTAAAAASAHATDENGFGSTAASAATAVAQPVVMRKKEKRPAPTTAESDPPTKKPTPEPRPE